MTFYAIEPEVAGGFGERTQIIDNVGRPMTVTHLHYQFDGWLGDELLASTPCFIVSKHLADELEGARLTGFSLDQVDVSTSPEFRAFKADVTLPQFLWLKVHGRANVDDFGLGERLRLVVSERALRLLEGKISHAASVVALPD